MNYDIVSPYVSEWLKDECDRTEHDFAMEEFRPLTEGEIDELEMQAPLNNISQLPLDETTTEIQPTYIYTQ